MGCDAGPAGAGAASACERRRVALLGMLVEQYGEAGVAVAAVGGAGGGGGEEAPAAAGGRFALDVALDDACARVEFSAAGVGSSSSSSTAVAAAGAAAHAPAPAGHFTVTLLRSGCREAAVVDRWLDSLERTCLLADSLCRPLILGVPAVVVVQKCPPAL